MEYTWKEAAQPERRKVENLSNLLQVSPIIATLLVQRGIETYDQAESFFKPKLSDLHDPFLMLGMEKAVQRIAFAIENNQKVLVYGDYDVDGTTSVATVYSFLRNLFDESQIDYYIPDRYREGYGVSKIGIDWAAENEFKLIVALDCGTRSIDLIDYAKRIDIDFIVCDHHLPGEQLPNAVALLNPKQPDCTYPYKELSGCGIGFKLNQALAIFFNLDPKLVYKALDLVAVSIASDIVDMMGENRVLMYLGLEKLNIEPCVGLQALIQSYAIKDVYEVSDIVFGLGPRINAAGRISDAKDSVKLLIDTDFHEAIKSAKRLNDHNLERKDKDLEITQEALFMIENDPSFLLKKATVIFGDKWHKGVIGIVASRLIEVHYKPTIVFSENDGVLTGSARSVRQFDIHEAIASCSQYVLQFGGHKYAAGLSVLKEKFVDFKKAFEQYVQDNIQEESLYPTIEYDTSLDLEELTPKFLRILDRFKPFGPGNMSPVFRSNSLFDGGYSKILKEKHLKVYASQQNFKIEGIAFSMAHALDVVKNGAFDCCFSPEWNKYNGKVSVQLKIRDIKSCNLELKTS